MNARCHRKCRDKTYTLRGILKNTKKKSDRRFIHGLLSEIKAFNEFKVQVQFWQQLHRKAACLNNDLVFSMLANDSRPLCCSGSGLSCTPWRASQLGIIPGAKVVTKQNVWCLKLCLPPPSDLSARCSNIWAPMMLVDSQIYCERMKWKTKHLDFPLRPLTFLTNVIFFKGRLHSALQI